MPRSPMPVASLRQGGVRTAVAMAAVTAALLVLFVPLAGRATAAEDPGFAYVDLNTDQQYEASDGDADLTGVVIDDGFDTSVAESGYDPSTACGGGSCAGAGLVIPASVGTITFANQASVTYEADGTLVFGVNTLDGGGNSDVVLRSNAGSVQLDDPIVRSEGDLSLEAPAGSVTAREDQLLACDQGGTVSVTASGLVDLSFTNIRADAQIDLVSATNGVELVSSVVGTAAVGGSVDVGANGDAGTIDATDALVVSDAAGTPEMNGDGSPPYTNGVVITTGALITQGRLACAEQVITEPPPPTTPVTTTTITHTTTSTATTTTGTTGTTTTGTTTTGTTTTGTTTSGTTTTGTTTTGTTTTGTTTTGTTTTTPGTTTTGTTSATTTTAATTSGSASSTTAIGGVGAGQQSTTGAVGGETAFTGVQNVMGLAGAALVLLTTGSGLLWIGSRRRWVLQTGRDDDMWLRR